MSFSGDTKTALTKIIPEDDCCAVSQMSGMLLFSSGFSRGKIVFSSETEAAAYLFSGLLLRCFDVASSPEVFEKNLSKTLIFRTTLEGADAEKIYGIICPDGAPHINKNRFSCPRCAEAFLRGVFLACGFVNPPDKTYGIEFSAESADLAVELAMLLSERFGMAKLSVRKGNQIIYYRDGTTVSEVLALMGAKKSAFEIMNSQAYRSIRNEQNRQTNFDVANISKLAAAAAAQIEAIELLEKSGKFEKLPVQLRQTAKLRRDNPALSLSELGALENPPVSKSQESKRLYKIMEFAGKTE